MAQIRKTRRRRRSERRPLGRRARLFGRTAGVASVVAMLVLGLASTGGARSISSFNQWLSYGGSTTTTYHSTTSTTKPSTTTTYHSTTTTTKPTTTTTHATTTTTKATTTTTHATTTTTMPRGGDGCTPGFWRQAHHYDSWVGFSPGDDYETVFGVNAVFEATLGEAVRLRGGGEYALARHAVAALLNSTSPDVDYAFTTGQVIDLVQDAYATGDFEEAKDMLADENEEGCTLS